MTTPSQGHTGITFLAASGDAGAPGGYPAYSPDVVAVGGTSLTLSGGNYGSEAGWSGSGGGISQYESQPSYQQGLVIHNGGNTVNASGMRTIPDVASDANPNTGVAVYDSYNGGSSPWYQVGGTSVATPCWAGLIALADQIRVSAGQTNLSGPTQTLPALYSLPAGDFHDITSGTSTGSPNYTAAAGYDLVTGLGTPRANLLVPDLALGSPQPDLTLTATHVGNFTPGDVGDTYTITVSNSGSGATTAAVSLVDTLPSGVTATAMSGTGWTVNLATLTATCSDALAAGASYPALTITVNVAANAPASLTNTATVSGGGELITSNDTVSDPTTLPADTVNVAYHQTLSVSGGTGTDTLAVSNIQNPIPGLVVPAASGSSTLSITGTPTASGTETFTVTATDTLGATASTNYSITVNGVVALGPASLPADTVNVAYHQTLTASGGTGSKGLAVSNIQNPIPGLVVPATGNNSLSITGTPTAAGTETFTITATDTLGAATSHNYSITVDPAVSLSPASLPADTINVAYHQTLTASGGTGTDTLAVTNIQNAIAGLAVPSGGSNSLSITGTPTATGTETFTVTATDALGATASTNYSITVNGAVSLGPSSLPADAVNVAYNQTLTASGGTGTKTLAISNIQNAIPGLAVPSSGNNSLAITGTPTATGTETFTVTATDTLGAAASHNYSITVDPAVSLSPTSLPADTINVAYHQTLTASGGTGALTLAVTNVQNPISGLIVPASGSNSLNITGTPTVPGTETFTVTVTDSLAVMTSTNYSITVNGPVTLGPASLPADTVNVPYVQTLTASGGTGTDTLVVTNIQNPIPGLTVPADGSNSLDITGTPTAAGTETFTVTVTDTLGATASTDYSITVNPAVALGPSSLPADTVSVAYNQTLTASGGTGADTLAVTNIQNAIAGLVMPASGSDTLSISGTPAATGTETFTVTATDTLGATASTDYSITVNPAVALGPAEPAGRHGQRALQPNAHRQRRHGHRYIGRYRRPEPHCRPDCACRRQQLADDHGHAHGHRDGDLHGHGHRHAGGHDLGELQCHSQWGRHARSLEPAGRHGQRGLQPDAHRQRRHGPRYFDRYQYPEPRRRFDCAFRRQQLADDHGHAHDNRD